MIFEERIEVSTPAEAAFAFASDFNNLPLWDPSIVRVEQLSPGQVGRNTRFRVDLRFFGVPSSLAYEVTEYEAGKRAVLVGESLAVTAVDTIKVQRRAAGTVLTWHADIRLAGWLRFLDPLLRLLFEPTARQATAGLRAELERLGTPQGSPPRKAAPRPRKGKRRGEEG